VRLSTKPTTSKNVRGVKENEREREKGRKNDR
jgi:hypothetical protein